MLAGSKHFVTFCSIVSLFDNYSDVNLSTHVLQRDLLSRNQLFYLSKHHLTTGILARRRGHRERRKSRKATHAETISQKEASQENLDDKDKSSKQEVKKERDTPVSTLVLQTKGEQDKLKIPEAGQLWTWGMGRNGKYDRLTRNLKEPRPLIFTESFQYPSAITSVACSSSHSLFTTGLLLTLALDPD